MRNYYARAHKIHKYIKESFNLGTKGKQVNEGKAFFFALAGAGRGGGKVSKAVCQQISL